MVVGPVTPTPPPVQPQTPPPANAAPPTPPPTQPAPPAPQPPPRTETVAINRSNGRDQVQISRQAIGATHNAPTRAETPPSQPGRSTATQAARPTNTPGGTPVRANPPGNTPTTPNQTAGPTPAGSSPLQDSTRGQRLNLLG